MEGTNVATRKIFKPGGSGKSRLIALALLLAVALGLGVWNLMKRAAATPAAPASLVASTASVPAAPASSAAPAVTKAASAASVPAVVASQPKAQASAPKVVTKPTAKASTSAAPAKVASAPKPASPAVTKVASAPKSEPYKWTRVGVDPCNPEVGCTLEWALAQAEWPKDVEAELMRKVKGESPEPYVMKSGWRGWMTWGKFERKSRADTLAAWPLGQEEDADLWFVEKAGTRYNLVQVNKCKNWGGFTSAVTAPTAKPQPSPNTMPLGVIPRVACPE